MTYRRSLARTGVFAVAFLISVLAGRLTVMDASDLSMVWPAAGVAVVWFCAQRQAPVRWADAAALAVITLVVNTATGASLALAVVFTVANLVQIGVFLRLIDRWRPGLADGTMRGPRDLWVLLGASFAATAAGAAAGPTGMWLITDQHSWSATLVWLARNTASILLIGGAGLTLPHALAVRRGAVVPSRARLAEYAALALCSGAAYWFGFVQDRHLPVTFLLIAVTVWVGVRFPTPFVVVHGLLVGTITMLITLSGHGSFADIADPATRAFVAQLFVAVVAVVGLALALGRDERDALIAALAAEKAQLAAQREELTSFAEVAAHDLLSPLTSISGWAEVATTAVEQLPANPSADQARDGLVRVSRSATRMRELIDDLLGYATAREAIVAPAVMDLAATLAEVTVARLDAAIAGGLPPPRFQVADLPPVRADPMLVRQLLDNLIGNAIKYTAPGVTPMLTVTATGDGPMVRVCVADNGIGIPAGQHDQIFGRFHRAHPSLGYAGTGLGLGICKRIVERHGGTIVAGDNPGGGSRFVFTLPSAARAGIPEPVQDSAQVG
ncbi:sensor histidine kinase [Actinoplanes derwentensis]|uniref:Sensor-like histidine kinase SenX3 n=1 Tax=Actinoplanes derwentensis TaxID=113562 RepID=A0A1H2BNW0_9ACTN|nr:ATP-binding protein [Actinoplanes derwentensis]GID86903.1 hypothetical protein Ade03nite_58270 [Actinoplanes derwentensis]SDT59747.1 Signal transduction histidine kinase [Actinoplanes derwentensis]